MKGDNVYIRKNGQRECRACSIARVLRARWKEKREARAHCGEKAK